MPPPPSSGGLTQEAMLGAYLVALLLAVTAGILSDVAALRQQRLVRSVALALLTLLGLVSASVMLPLLLDSAFFGLPAPDIVLAFAPLVVLPLAALGSLLLARSRPGTRAERSSGTDAAVPTSSTPTGRQPGARLAVVSVVAALYAPGAALLAAVLWQLALAASPRVCGPGIGRCPPPESLETRGLNLLVSGLVLLILPAVVVAIVCGHLAVSQMRHQPTRRFWRMLALGGLILAYCAPPLLVVFYYFFALWSGFGGE